MWVKFQEFVEHVRFLLTLGSRFARLTCCERRLYDFAFGFLDVCYLIRVCGVVDDAHVVIFSCAGALSTS